MIINKAYIVSQIIGLPNGYHNRTEWYITRNTCSDKVKTVLDRVLKTQIIQFPTLEDIRGKNLPQTFNKIFVFDRAYPFEDTEIQFMNHNRFIAMTVPGRARFFK